MPPQVKTKGELRNLLTWNGGVRESIGERFAKRNTWERMYADRFSQPKRPPPLWPVPRPGKFHRLQPPPAYIPVLQVDTKSDYVGYGKLAEKEMETDFCGITVRRRSGARAR